MGDTSELFDGLLGSWEIALRAAGRSPRTIDSYLESARMLDTWLAENGRPRELAKVRRRDLQEWVVDHMETRSAATARIRYASVQQLFRWAVAEGEVEQNPFDGMSPPPIPERDVDVIPDDQLDALLRESEPK
jgi:site-specific recombinase XerD